jgi:hypothetical protein
LVKKKAAVIGNCFPIVGWIEERDPTIHLRDPDVLDPTIHVLDPDVLDQTIHVRDPTINVRDPTNKCWVIRSGHSL